MKKIFAISAATLAAGFATAPASATDILARVISSTPVVQQVAVPRQVCSNQAIITPAPKSGAGALMGALAGGAVGNAIGGGGGRAAATVIGLVGGAVIGDSIEGPNNQVQNVQRCATQTSYENRTSYYNVVYEYQGTQYNVQMTSDPGPYVRLQVTPVGAITPAPEAAAPDQSQAYAQPAPVAPPVYEQQPVAAAVAYPGYYYPQPYYAPPYYTPFYPLGLSLNFGYSRGFGGHYRR